MLSTISQDDDSNDHVSPQHDDPKSNWHDKQEIGGKAMWTLSSAKPGFGVEQLRDDSIETYWQSDGVQPHTINIHFPYKVNIEEVCIYSNYAQDESYTPSLLSIKAGTTYHDLQEIKLQPMKEPTGWISIPLLGPNNQPLKTHFLQLAILANHQNGRDTHLRQVKVFGTKQAAVPLQVIPNFSTVETSFHSFLR